MSYSSAQQERQPEAQTLPPDLFEAAAAVRNIDPHNLVAPLREVDRIIAKASVGEETAKEIQVAVRLQQEWDAWLVERDLLRNETQRGRECLEQIRSELTGLRLQLEEWPAHERICGHNPLPDYLLPFIRKNSLKAFCPPGWSAVNSNWQRSRAKWKFAPNRMAWNTCSSSRPLDV